jgi:hypothetical protein
MGDLTQASPTVLPLHFSTLHGGANGLQSIVAVAVGTSAARTWVANLIQYNPVTVTRAYPVKRAFWINGSTTASTSVQFGIYTEDGTLIYTTGDVAMSGGSAIQYETVSPDFVLQPGRYYFAWTCNNTATNRGFTLTSATVNNNRLMGLLEETTAEFGLPAMMNPVAFTRAWAHNICGVTRTTTGF